MTQKPPTPVTPAPRGGHTSTAGPAAPPPRPDGPAPAPRARTAGAAPAATTTPAAQAAGAQ
ncbi:hypothetical protein ACFXD5_35735, partial [Streptomyces sp. NPDC059385]